MTVTPMPQPPDRPRPGGLDLSAFASDQPPASTSRGPRGVWLDRFDDLLDQVPGKWVNATAAWGTKKTAGQTIRKNAERAELTVETRVSTAGDLWIKVQ